MEENYPQQQRIHFHGQGSKLFGIYILNILLSIVTLGLYYPWAKAAVLQYIYEETEFEQSRFTFHGTGREMFKGFIKAIAIFIALYAPVIVASVSRNMPFLIGALIYFYAGLALLIPVAIHGSLRYRMSRTSWRGIHFGYRGSLGELVKLCIKGTLLTIFTLGLYSFWFIVDIRKYIFKNIRFGNVSFGYVGSGDNYFVINLKGYFLTLFTLGIYSFWYVRDLFNFYVDNIRVYQGEKRLRLRSTATAGGYFKLIFINLLIIICTLGLGTPWAIVRALHFVWDNIVIEGGLDVDAILQTEENYKDATGEDLADMIDIGLV